MMNSSSWGPSSISTAEAHPFSGPLCAWPARRGGRCSAAPDSGG